MEICEICKKPIMNRWEKTVELNEKEEDSYTCKECSGEEEIIY